MLHRTECRRALRGSQGLRRLYAGAGHDRLFDGEYEILDGNLYGASRRICGLRRRRQCYVPAAGYAVGRREQYVQPPAVDRQFQFRYHVAPEHVRADQLRVRTRLIVPRPCGVSGENRAIFGGGAVRHFFCVGLSIQPITQSL